MVMGSEAVSWVEAEPTPGQSPGPRSASRPVDLVHLSRYTLGDRALEREVLELFCTQSAIYLERLNQAHTDREWRDAAHSLKGLAQAIGAWRAAEAARQAEALAGGVLVQLRALHLRGVESAVREAELYIRRLLKDR
jgi:HPt (histidine-containing phosphotransfer) domain-containing protein